MGRLQAAAEYCVVCECAYVEMQFLFYKLTGSLLLGNVYCFESKTFGLAFTLSNHRANI